MPINQDNINCVLTDGPYSGRTHAFALVAKHNRQQDANMLDVLIANDYALARSITPDNLNSLVDLGDRGQASLALLLSLSNMGMNILAVIADKITAVSLNTLVTYKGMRNTSLAAMLASKKTPKGRLILEANNHELLRNINNGTLNAILNCNNNSGAPELIGTSVAYWLAQHSMLGLLLEQPGLSIEPATLNRIIPHGPSAGSSLAFWLARNELDLLDEHDYLPSNISSEAMNSRLSPNAGDKANLSVAYILASTSQGREILEHDFGVTDFKLLKMITHETMNAFVSLPGYDGFSTALWLGMNDYLFEEWFNHSIDNNISDAVHSRIIMDGRFKGLSFLHLAFSRLRHIHDLDFLAESITEELLNSICESPIEDLNPNETVVGFRCNASLAFTIAQENIDIFQRNNNALLKLVNRRTLNCVTSRLEEYPKLDGLDYTNSRPPSWDSEIEVKDTLYTKFMESDQGRECLAANDYRLWKLVDPRFLNETKITPDKHELNLAILDGYQFEHECTVTDCKSECPFAILNASITEIDAILARTENPGYTFALLAMLWNKTGDDKPFLRDTLENAFARLLNNNFTENQVVHHQLMSILQFRFPALLMQVLAENHLVSIATVKRVISIICDGLEQNKDQYLSYEEIEELLHNVSAVKNIDGMEQLYEKFYFARGRVVPLNSDSPEAFFNDGPMKRGFLAAFNRYQAEGTAFVVPTTATSTSALPNEEPGNKRFRIGR